MSYHILNKIYVVEAQTAITYCILVWGIADRNRFMGLERAQGYLIMVMYSISYRFCMNANKATKLLSIS